jgi:hypothetical protein
LHGKVNPLIESLIESVGMMRLEVRWTINCQTAAFLNLLWHPTPGDEATPPVFERTSH